MRMKAGEGKRAKVAQQCGGKQDEQESGHKQKIVKERGRKVKKTAKGRIGNRQKVVIKQLKKGMYKNRQNKSQMAKSKRPE